MDQTAELSSRLPSQCRNCMPKANILIVEDKFIVAEDIAVSVRKLGYDVVGVLASGEEVVSTVRELHPDLVLMDIRLKGQLDGIEVAESLQKEFGLPVIYLTAHSDSETLERAGMTDPYGYILKPFDDQQLYTVIELALNRRRTLRDCMHDNTRRSFRNQAIGEMRERSIKDSSHTSVRSRVEFSSIIGSHEKMLALLATIEIVAKTDVTVHIFGENGTGKELVADAIHKISVRSEKPFIKLNCSAIPHTLLESALFGHSKGAFTGAGKDQEGFVERAHGGTLFLDEIGDVSHDIQVKLLRVLQSREFHRVGDTSVRQVDIRIITATNQDLKALMRQGKIREDFYYRINVFPIVVPPLRERGEDIIEIADYFRKVFNPMFGKDVQTISEEAKKALLAYQWPGNVRELENIMKRAFVLVAGDSIECCHLPVEITDLQPQLTLDQSREGSAIGESGDLCEREAILNALKKTGGNKRKAAKLLGFSRVTLWKKLTKLGVASQFASSDDSSNNENDSRSSSRDHTSRL